MPDESASPVKLEASYKAPGILYAMCCDSEQQVLYGGGADWSVYSVDLKAESPKAESPKAEARWTHHANYISCMVLQGEQIISGGFDRRLIWTDHKTGDKVRDVDAHAGWVRDLQAIPGSPQLASVGDDMLVKVWDVETGELLHSLDGHAKQTPQGYATALYSLAVSPSGEILASGDRIGTVCLWDIASGERIAELKAPTFYTYDAQARIRSIGGIRGLRFSPDGETLAISGIGKVTNVDGFVGPSRVELWDWRKGELIASLQHKHKAVLNDIHFHPSQPWLVAGGGGDSGGALFFWDWKAQKLIHQAKPKGHLQALCLDRQQPRLFAVGHEGFQVWSLALDK